MNTTRTELIRAQQCENKAENESGF